MSQPSCLNYITSALTEKPANEWVYSSTNAKHFVAEKFTYVPRAAVGADVVYTFKCRQEIRCASSAPNDKDNNRLTALTGMMGIGKSTELAHLGESSSYKNYVSDFGDRPAIVSLVTFSSGMSSFREDVFGLRVVFGVMHAMGMSAISWSDFLDEFKGTYADLSAREATKFLRSLIGDETRILMCVDELKQARDSGGVMRDLGDVLAFDAYTDVAVSSLSPAYVCSLLSNSSRGIDYIPITPLDTERILEYNAQVNSFIVALKVRLLEKGVAPLGELNERVIQAMHVMAAGHGRTLQHMVEKMKNGLLLDEITDNWRKIANRKKNIEPLLLLRLISERRDIFTFSHPPETDVERDVILSCRVHDAIDDVVFRCMLEENKCFIHRRESSGFGDQRFMATTTLASFFGMIQSIKDMSSGLGHLSRAAATLFCTLGHTVYLATVWERCRAMTLVSRAKMLGDLCTVDMVFAVNDGSLCREDIPLLPLNVEARLAEDVSDLQYTENTVLVAPKSQAGWDIVVYSRDGYCHFEQVKVAMPKSFEAMPAYSIENLIAHSLEGILKFYWDTLGIKTETRGEEFAQLEKERELLGKVTFVLSIADCNAPKWVKCSIDTMLEVLHHRQEIGTGTHSNLVIRYVEQHWDNVGYLDWDDLRKCMPPVLLPFAQLAHAAQTPETR